MYQIFSPEIAAIRSKNPTSALSVATRLGVITIHIFIPSTEVYYSKNTQSKAEGPEVGDLALNDSLSAVLRHDSLNGWIGLRRTWLNLTHLWKEQTHNKPTDFCRSSQMNYPVCHILHLFNHSDHCGKWCCEERLTPLVGSIMCYEFWLLVSRVEVCH